MNLLIVDDEASLRDFLSIVFEGEGWHVEAAPSLGDARAALQRGEPDVVLCDLMLPDGSGIDLIREVKASLPSVAFVMITAHTSTKSAIDALKAGAIDYIAKPFDIEELKIVVRKAVERKELEDENVHLRTALEERFTFSNIIGRSPKMQEIFSIVQRIARTQSTVLISGESGTGKELIARAIHYNSDRRGKFVSINCGALPETLLESELFGHERGAFTNATTTKPGLFEIAGEGTLFLDEIGEMPLALQARLLKAIEEKRFRRVGGTRDIRADFRLVAATNRDLNAEVTAGRFRADLYYRLNVVRLRLPPLRERMEDLPILVEEILRPLAKELGRPVPRITARAMQKLQSFAWPGNVRELRNVLERALLTLHGDEIRNEDLVLESAASPIPSSGGGLPAEEWDIQPLDDVIARYVSAAVDATGGNVRKAARQLKISPSTLYARLKEAEGLRAR